MLAHLLLLLVQVPATGRVERHVLMYDGTDRVWPFGSAVAGCGDVDGDGVEDLAVATPRPELGAVGRVQLFSGADGCELRRWEGERRDGLFGFALGAVDLDGDGREELLVSELFGTGEPGRVTAFDTHLGHEVKRFASGVRGEDFGWSLDAGDVTGDGFIEVVVGAPTGAEGTGAVYVFSAGSTLVTALPGNSAGDRLGWSLDASADFDGDGANEFVVGAPRAGGAGAVIVWSVARGAELARLDGEQEGEGFGFSVCALRDARSERAGLAVGSPWYDGFHVNQGAVYVFDSLESTRRSLHPAHRTYVHTGRELHAGGCLTGMLFGHGVLALPEVDGDGQNDLAVTAIGGFGNWGCPSGWVAIVSGATGEWLEKLSGSSAIWNFGAAMDLVSGPAGEPVLLFGGPGDGWFHERPMVDRRGARDGEHFGRIESLLRAPSLEPALGR